MMKRAAIPVILAAQLASARAYFNFSHAYSDSMVLQRAPHPASVWGYAAPGAKVTVAIEAAGTGEVVASASVVASDGGAWRTSLPPQPASTTPVKITAKDGSQTITLSDVLFGDVTTFSGGGRGGLITLSGRVFGNDCIPDIFPNYLRCSLFKALTV